MAGGNNNMISTVKYYKIDDSYKGQLKLIKEIQQQNRELQEMRQLNEKLENYKPTLEEIKKRYGINK